MRPGCVWVAAALTALALAGCGHDLRNGTYTFNRSGPPERDTCNLAPSNGTLWTGTVVTSGQEVFVDLSVPVEGEPAQIVRLSGFFKAPQYGTPDGFLADFTALQVPAPLPGVNGGCLADSLMVHMDATVPQDERIFGTLEMTYALTPPAPPNACAGVSRCELEVSFQASRMSN